MADPAMAAARAVDQLTDEPLPGLPMTDVDRIEDDILAELSILSIKPQLQALCVQAEALAKLVWEGTERCDFCRGRECDWCLAAKAFLTSLGFYDRMVEWAGR